MDVSVSIGLFVSFDENEVCNPDALQEFKKYLEFHGIAYVVYDNMHLPMKQAVREIQIFCPANYAHTDILLINDEIQKLTDPVTLPGEWDRPEKRPDAPVIRQPQTLTIRERQKIHRLNNTTQQTPLNFFQK